MFGCWGVCSEKIKIVDRGGQSTTFYIRERLDQGGFSTIELASPSHSRQLFVLKRILCHSKSDEEKALREAHLHLGLPSHPNLLPCLGVGRKALLGHPQGAVSQVCMILQYAQQGTLQRYLERSRSRANPIPEKVIARLMMGICEGLLVLLSLNMPLAHRDLKPGNVLLFGTWCPVLMDFGSCTPAVIEIKTYKDVEYWKEFAAENCSMTYRAPELFQPPLGQCITERADIWSLGCLLYALYFFESPLDKIHAKGDSVALAACSANIQFPPEWSSKMSPGMMNLIKSMLALDPLTRPSLQQVINTIEALEPDASKDWATEVVAVEPFPS